MEIEVGTIVGTHGIKGEVKIYATTDFADARFAVGNKVTLVLKQKQVELEIASHRYHKKMDLVKFVGLDSINDVEQYRGAIVYANQDDDLDEGEYYYGDLIGCQVQDEDGHDLGKVISILEMPTQDVLEVEDHANTYMIPYVDAFIVDEDVENGVIIVSLIEGMRP